MIRFETDIIGGHMNSQFTAPAAMPHSPDGNMNYDIVKYVLAHPELAARAGIGESDRLEAISSEQAAQNYWRRLQEFSAQSGTSLSLADNGIPQNHLIVPNLSNVEGLIEPDPNGTPFFVPTQPVDDPAGGISYDRWKALIANPETRAMMGIDDKTASWLMRSEEGAFMWYQQALANENQATVLGAQDAMGEIEQHVSDSFKYGQAAVMVLGAVFVLALFMFFVL